MVTKNARSNGNGWWKQLFGDAEHETQVPGPKRDDEERVDDPSDVNLDALQALADVIGILGRIAPELPMDTAAPTFADRTQAWVAHLLRGDPAPIGALAGSARAAGKRAFTDLRMFVSQRRELERGYMLDTLATVQSTVRAFIDQVRSTVLAGAADDDEASLALDHLERLVSRSGTDVETVRIEVRRTVSLLRNQLDARRERQKEQLSALQVVMKGLRSEADNVKRATQTDELTKLDNRRSFDDIVEQEARRAASDSEALSIVVLEVDQYDTIVAAHGAGSAREVLKVLSAELTKVFGRRARSIARLSTAEFAVLLVDTDEIEAIQLAEDLLSAVRSQPVHLADTAVSLTCSAGLATLQSAEAPDVFFERADRALIRARNDGHDQVVS